MMHCSKTRNVRFTLPSSTCRLEGSYKRSPGWALWGRHDGARRFAGFATTGVFTSRGPTAEQHPQDGTTCLLPSHDERGCHTPPAGEPRPPRLAAH